MFKTTGDIMKIVWSGLKDIKKKCSVYIRKDSENTYKEIINRISTEFSHTDSKEERLEAFLKKNHELMRAVRRLACILIYTVLLSLILTVIYGQWLDFRTYILAMAAVAVLFFIGISHQIKKIFVLKFEIKILESVDQKN